MKALSIRQPWAYLICAGHKDIENRTWPTKYRGPVLIHAGKMPDETAPIFTINGIEIPVGYPLGGIVGIAELVACFTSSQSKWFSGPYGFVLRYARPLPFLRCRGQLGFFEVDYKL